MKIPNILTTSTKDKELNKYKKLNKDKRLNGEGSLIWINFKGNDESFGDMDIPTIYLMDEDGY